MFKESRMRNIVEIWKRGKSWRSSLHDEKDVLFSIFCSLIVSDPNARPQTRILWRLEAKDRYHAGIAAEAEAAEAEAAEAKQI